MMRSLPWRRATLLAPLLGVLGSAHAGTVTVEFLHPENYTDVHVEGDVNVQVLQPLAQGLKRLGQRLPADQTLVIQVSNIDLAGDWRPPPRLGLEVRVMTPASWPRIDLHYQLKDASGRDLQAGDAEIKDMGYQDSITTLIDSTPLRYEQKMLRDWFGRTFPNPAP